MKRILAVFLMLLSFGVYAETGAGINVFVSIPPQKYLVERIGGERVKVDVMLSPGQSPETFEPTPRQIAMLSGAHIYFRIGVPFEDHWLDVMAGHNKNMSLVNCCRQLMRNNDPHVWTSPKNAGIIAELIFRALSTSDPGGTSLYESNYRTLVNDLEGLDRSIVETLGRRRTDYFIVSHDSWNYFASEYGLIQLALETNGKDIGPRGLSRLVDMANSEGIKTIFIQQQHADGVARTLANELQAEIVNIDPLAEDYIDNLSLVSKKIAEAIR